jgi:hypothetical protein
MATVITAAPANVRPAGAYDRTFYTSLSILMALTVVGGFGPTYYFAGSQARTIAGNPVTPLVHLHGFLFSAWVLLFIVQTSLIATRRVAVHRRLGIAGVGLAIGMIVVGLRTAIVAAKGGVAPGGVDPLVFLVVPMFDIVCFAAFVTAAVLQRRNKEAHKRLMLLAYVSIIIAATARLPGVLPLGPPGFFGLAFLFVVAGIVYDRWSRGKVHPVYIWGGAALVISVPLRLALSTTAAWRAFAGWLVGG